MPRINPEVLIPKLEFLRELLTDIYGLSKNHEITMKAEDAGDLLDNLIRTLLTLSVRPKGEKSPPSATTPTTPETT